MFTLPEAIKSDATVYSAITWDAEQGLYKWTESMTYYTTEAKLAEYKQEQLNSKAAEEAHDSVLTLAIIQEELDWIAAGEATKT